MWYGECNMVEWEVEGFGGYLEEVWAGRGVVGRSGTGGCREKGRYGVALEELFLDGATGGVGLEASTD